MSDDSLASQAPAAPDPQRRRRVIRRATIALVVLLVGLGAASLRVLGLRLAQAEALQKSLGDQQKVFVAYTFPRPVSGDGSASVQLPGTLQGGRETIVYARSNGYVKRWLRDIGARVRKGDLIAEIETPELDQQIAQARANARQTGVNVDLARQTLARWKALRKDDLVTQQELDERAATVEQLGAAQAAAQAEVARLEALAAFQRIEAPFDGVITRRNVELGSLVNAGNGGSAQSLFQLASTDRLRLEIYVPQSYANQVKVGMPVDVTQAELGGRHFQGRIARTSGAIDSTTRTLQVEVEIRNREGLLLPGSYVQASLPLLRGKALAVPANALLFRSEGPRLGIVDDAGKVRLAPITLGRDLGKTIEILAGLDARDHVILNPPDSLGEGDQVDAKEVVAPKPAAASPAGPPAAAATAPATPGAATTDKGK